MSTQDWKDEPVATRKGEELDIAKLKHFLTPHIGPIEGELIIQQFPGGYSNLTYAINVNNREWVLRRPPFGANIKSGHDMSREFRILSALDGRYPKIPKSIVFCEDEGVMGCPFYIMERVSGVILRPNMSPEMSPNPKLMSGIANAWLDTLIELHQVDYQETGLGDFGKPEGYVHRQVEGWGKRYFNAKTDEVPKLENALKWLEANQPSESATTLIHNDFKYDNLVLDADDWTKVRAVLDWEMATIGDPLMDLGTSLGYWVNHDDPPFMLQMKLSPTHLPGNPKRGEIIHQYALKAGKEIQRPVFIYVYGLFKIAVIAQQIYARYKQGFSKDPRFAALIDGVKAMGEMADRAIERKKVDDLF